MTDDTRIIHVNGEDYSFAQLSDALQHCSPPGKGLTLREQTNAAVARFRELFPDISEKDMGSLASAFMHWNR